MTVHSDYQRARCDALAFLTALHHKRVEDAADVYEDSPDQGLMAYVLGLMFLGALGEAHEQGSWSAADALRAMGIANAEMA